MKFRTRSMIDTNTFDMWWVIQIKQDKEWCLLTEGKEIKKFDTRKDAQKFGRDLVRDRKRMDAEAKGEAA